MEDLKANWKLERKWESNMQAQNRSHLILKWRNAIERSFDWQSG